ncbi:YceI family protein [Rhodohalobacter mucosus]|uniref:YceI family protein n=1 Tax=Rhodohalobacter mucosus TaxID=2079485 RepID=A0A316TPX7_9BACT|nr:YceI family protein [Rhodohalobacter mucosus]PWN05075.1 YceI family protein [Rhodohalobacter mucosus]
MKYRLQSVLFFAVLFFAAGTINGSLIAQIEYVPQDSSRLWIAGQSNVNQFECESREHRGEAIIFQTTTITGDTVTVDEDATKIMLEIDVEGIECGRNRMNRDLRNALKADDYPNITFVFNEIVSISENGHSNSVELEVNGLLTIAGVTREVNVHLTGYTLDDNRVRAEGSKEILMTDFGVEPPTAMLGLVKADNELTVHFDLIAARKAD